MELGAKRDISTTKCPKYEIGQCSDVGLVRSINEDSLLTLNFDNAGLSDLKVSLYAIADGLGGYRGGDIASKIALKVLTDNISKFILSTASQTDIHNQKLVLEALTVGVMAANNEVVSQGLAHGNNMATTLVTALLINDNAYIANVGDSRAYCLDEVQIHQITVDHSLVAKLVESGEIRPEELYTHPQRNIVTRWLGSQLNIEVDLFNELLNPNKSLILCSDGLWEMVKDFNIEKIIREQSTAQEACMQLVNMAKQNGGLDNISVIIVKVLS